jgi:hypothetical protein
VVTETLIAVASGVIAGMGLAAVAGDASDMIRTPERRNSR